MPSRLTPRLLVAAVLVLLAAGTVFAVDPSISPLASPSASDQPSASTQASPSSNSPAASKAPEKSESPEASESPEGSEAPEASESPEASEAPELNESETAPSAAELDRLVGLLKDAGITTTAQVLKDLAAKVGVGGAVRTVAFAKYANKTPAAILAMFQGGMGWGKISHTLNLSIGPGIGWIMGNGHGNGNGNGKNKVHGANKQGKDKSVASDLGSGQH
jgi:hypothetical protein